MGCDLPQKLEFRPTRNHLPVAHDARRVLRQAQARGVKRAGGSSTVGNSRCSPSSLLPSLLPPPSSLLPPCFSLLPSPSASSCRPREPYCPGSTWLSSVLVVRSASRKNTKMARHR